MKERIVKPAAIQSRFDQMELKTLRLTVEDQQRNIEDYVRMLIALVLQHGDSLTVNIETLRSIKPDMTLVGQGQEDGSVRLMVVQGSAQ